MGWLLKNYGWGSFYWAMAPFSAVGTLLMTYIWLTTRGRDVKGS